MFWHWWIYLTWAIILVAGKINWNNREFNNWILWGGYISTSAWNYYSEQPTIYKRSKEQDHFTHSFWQAAQHVSIMVYSWYYCCNGWRSHFVDSHDAVDMVEMYHTCQGLLFCYKTKPYDTPQAVTSCTVSTAQPSMQCGLTVSGMILYIKKWIAAVPFKVILLAATYKTILVCYICKHFQKVPSDVPFHICDAFCWTFSNDQKCIHFRSGFAAGNRKKLHGAKLGECFHRQICFLIRKFYHLLCQSPPVSQEGNKAT